MMVKHHIPIPFLEIIRFGIYINRPPQMFLADEDGSIKTLRIRIEGRAIGRDLY